MRPYHVAVLFAAAAGGSIPALHPAAVRPLAAVTVADARSRMARGFLDSLGDRAQLPHGTLLDTLVAQERQSWVAWQKRDGQFFAQFLSDDHVEVGGQGISGKATVVAFVGSPTCVVTSYALSGFSLKSFAQNAALLTYRAEQATKCGGVAVPSPVWVGSLYINRHGRWLNAAYQQTPAQK